MPKINKNNSFKYSFILNIESLLFIKYDSILFC